MPRWLGLAGLLPQIAVAAVVLSGDTAHRFNALALGYAYAAIILSFLGGIWWGIGASHANPPEWLWVAAVTPSLIALASAVPWALGDPWPGPSLLVLGVALIAALAVDIALNRRKLTPPWWMGLRLPLSLGLGGLTLLLGLF
ncbi:DUF3429 domain-containing protein [Sphingomonas echinoides]|uniref:DUF3429 domain-containing protein n=1 Tax=Sphingomonas echinoides TaxID=59803 RepID=A0ABU4PI44_9SPHN|nr:DUF3429 domain-containing protein [Sphingomonas echinoides]MDX5982752.1 DUF3429 domain-containing protein [Sphingomonas echinoides]